MMTHLAVVVSCCTCSSHQDLNGLRVCSMLGTVVLDQVPHVFVSVLQAGRRLHMGSL